MAGCDKVGSTSRTVYMGQRSDHSSTVLSFLETVSSQLHAEKVDMAALQQKHSSLMEHVSVSLIGLD